MSNNEPGYFTVDLENADTGMSMTIHHVAAKSAKQAVAIALAWVVNPGQWRCTGTDRSHPPSR